MPTEAGAMFQLLGNVYVYTRGCYKQLGMPDCGPDIHDSGAACVADHVAGSI